MKSPVPVQPSREEFLKLAEQGNLIPVYADFIADAETPVSAFQKLGGDGYAFLLESVEKVDQVGRYSFVGSHPDVIFESIGRTVTVHEREESRSFEAEEDPLSELRKLMSRYRPAGMPDGFPPFSGGAVGVMGYDTVRFFEPTVPPPPQDDLGLPEMLFMVTSTILIFDHQLRRLRVVANAFLGDNDPSDVYENARARIAEITARLSEPARLPLVTPAIERELVEPSSNTAKEDYLEMVRTSKEYIRAGDIFQIVPSQRFQTPYSGDALGLYRALRMVNPSPYMFCLRFGPRFSLVGSSPEVHVRVVDDMVEIRPIAGTRRRGVSREQDEENERDLLGDPKERAEHIMLVDLARNDVGRIAEFDTVRVRDLMIVERYSHVMHIVSDVVGRLAEKRDAYDVLRATFPAGTVSGAPKVRAMQIINQLEKSKRGPYSGVVGYFGFDGNLDSCIVLRTVVLKDGTAFVQAGGGVVADSTPDGEYQETVNKAMGMIRAIEMANAMCVSEEEDRQR